MKIDRAYSGKVKSSWSRFSYQVFGQSGASVFASKFRPTVSMIVAIMAAIIVSCTGAKAEPFLGQVMITGSNFCPRGWAEANGQLVAISTNEALFSLYGTIYGGDGRTTFGLPDLRGRVPIHRGQGPGLSPRKIGSAAGSDVISVAKGDKEKYAGPPSLTLLYCIAFQGIYPSRQ